MNAIVTQNFRPPAHLAALQANTHLQAVNASAGGGISAGGWPRISLKGGRFRLQSPQGEEIVIPQHWLDVVVVDANPTLSKIYYPGNYDPASEGSAPSCYSDNGQAPSIRAVKPQCGTCAACPHNVWGSKITPTGAKTKACTDVKKVAVLIADNTSGPVFELRIPPASLSNFGAYVRSLDAAGIPAAGIVTRLQFDTNSDFPKLQFDARPVVGNESPYVTEEQMQDVLEVVGSPEVYQCTGAKDQPIDSTKALAAPASSPPAQPAPPAAYYPPQGLPPAPQGVPTPATQPLAEAQLAAQPEAPQRRTRRTAPKEAPQAQFNLPPAVGAAPPVQVANAVDQAVPLTPPVTNAALDDLIAQAMAT